MQETEDVDFGVSRPFVTQIEMSPTASANRFDYLASPINSFKFKDGLLADGIGQGTLRVEGRGKIHGSEYVFSKNEGPTLVPPILLTNSGEYAIEMSIKLQDPVADGDGIIKILDFNNLSSNHGAYIIESRLGYIAEGGEGLLESTEVNIRAGVYAHLVITRRYDTRAVTFYVDGAKVLSLDDWNEDFVIGPGGLRFFQDDGTSSTDEFCVKSARCHSGSGSIDYIKIYDSPLTSDDVALLFIQGEESPTVAACQCDSGGACIEEALSHQVLNVCLRCDRGDDFAIVAVDKFEYDQGGIVEVAVERGAERMTSTVSHEEEYTMISTFLPKSFSYGYGNDDDVLPIRGSGTVSLAAKMTLNNEDRGLRGVQTLQRQKEQLQRQQRRGQEQMRISVDFDLEFSEIESPDDDFWVPPLSDLVDRSTPAPATTPASDAVLELTVREKSSLEDPSKAKVTTFVMVLLPLIFIFLLAYACKKVYDKYLKPKR